MPVPEDPLLHDVIAAYVCDVYMIDPALQVHGHSMMARTHRSGTTDSSIWFHRPVRADRWNLLETRSPAAARGRGVITGSLIGADGDDRRHRWRRRASSPSGSSRPELTGQCRATRIRLRTTVTSSGQHDARPATDAMTPSSRCSPNSGYTW